MGKSKILERLLTEVVRLYRVKPVNQRVNNSILDLKTHIHDKMTFSSF